MNALVIGASTGYGLASRIALTYAYGAKTLGLLYERQLMTDALHRLATITPLPSINKRQRTDFSHRVSTGTRFQMR